MTTHVTNFGRNISFAPQAVVEPRTEAELLELLRDCRLGKLRVVGSRHSWSPLVETDDTLVRMRHFDDVRLHQKDGRTFATVGGGCQIKRVLAELDRHGYTMPSVGLITEQTIAGAIATGTHGSGRHSLSHYVTALRIACYDTAGDEPRIVDICEGDDLRAARCALGCLGIVVEVTLPVVPQYFVREQAACAESVEEMLALEPESPLQQFFLLPHAWTFIAQRRSVAAKNHRQGFAGIYRIYWFLTLDIGMHLLIKLFASLLKSRWLTRLLFRRGVPAFAFERWVSVDRSDRQLVMEHELFRHLEMELFVRRPQLVEATRYVTDILRLADDPAHELSRPTLALLADMEGGDGVQQLAGCHTHHYPICFRRVQPDDTLLSMASGGAEDWYAISLITYVEPRDRFYRLATFLAVTTHHLFGARIHWGKWFPLDGDLVAQQYPHLADFREVCGRHDPRGVFRNDFLSQRLGFDSR